MNNFQQDLIDRVEYQAQIAKEYIGRTPRILSDAKKNKKRHLKVIKNIQKTTFYFLFSVQGNPDRHFNRGYYNYADSSIEMSILLTLNYTKYQSILALGTRPFFLHKDEISIFS